MVSCYRRMKPLLGTFVEIGIDPNQQDGEFIVNKAFDCIKKIHDQLSFHEPNSDLSLLNLSKGQKTQIDQLSVNVIKLAKFMTRDSQNYFNCTVGNHFKNNTENSFCGNSEDIYIQGNTVQLKNNITLILDGVAKGFAIDLAVKSLKKKGVSFGWVNAGGDLRVFGDMEWPIYIKNTQGQTEKIVYIKNAAIATSHVSVASNKRFPAKLISSHDRPTEIGTWSVVSKSAWRADALTKVAANAPQDQKNAIIKRLGGELIDLNQGIRL